MARDRKQIIRQRFERQFRYFAARLPMLERMRRPGWMLVRILTGVLLVIGGLLAILPVLNVWMIPLGLLLLAIDLPMLQGPLSRFIIYGRRRVERFRRDWLRCHAR